MKIEIKGLKELESLIGKKAEATPLVKKVVMTNGAELTRKITRNAEPGVVFKKGYSVGNIKRALYVKKSSDGLTFRVISPTEYAFYQEYGTRKMSAQPFISPALKEQKSQFLRDLEKVVKWE